MNFPCYSSKVLCQIGARCAATWKEDSLFLKKLRLSIVLPLPKQYMRNYSFNGFMSQNTGKLLPVLFSLYYCDLLSLISVTDATEAAATCPAALESSFLPVAKRLFSWSAMSRCVCKNVWSGCE